MQLNLRGSLVDDRYEVRQGQISLGRSEERQKICLPSAHLHVALGVIQLLVVLSVLLLRVVHRAHLIRGEFVVNSSGAPVSSHCRS